jgi:hypothetical protein
MNDGLMDGLWMKLDESNSEAEEDDGWMQQTWKEESGPSYMKLRDSAG